MSAAQSERLRKGETFFSSSSSSKRAAMPSRSGFVAKSGGRESIKRAGRDISSAESPAAAISDAFNACDTF